MTTFARLVDGVALDCQILATATELAARFHPEWLAKHPFVVVPDGTIHGAVDNGNGTFTNPVLPEPVAPPAPAPDPIAVLTEKIDQLTSALAVAVPATAQILADK